MGIMAVKILVRKVQTDTEKIKTGRQERKHPHTHQQKGLLVVRVRGGTSHVEVLPSVPWKVTSLGERVLVEVR